MKYIYQKRNLLAIAMLFAGSRHAAGQQAATALSMADCVKVLRSDSVHMFFNTTYALVPPDCADIRLEGKMNSQGNFVGEVRDYQVADNTLLHKSNYANGVRNGLYEQHYGNQQLAVKGEFTQGKPSGTWQYWYANGQPQRTLELSTTGTVRLLACWDSTGRQQVINGKGTWQEIAGSGALASQTSGKVIGGLREGTWERRLLLRDQLLIVEYYRAGQLLEGHQYIGTAGNPQKYKTMSLLEPQFMDASARIEPFHFGLTCAQQAAEREKAALAPKIVITQKPPQPPKESGAYQNAVLRRLQQFNNSTQWLPRTDGQEVVITADITETGQLHNFACETALLATAFASITNELGTWHPATVNGIPTLGKLRFTLRMYSTQLQSSMATYALPGKALQQLNKPQK